MYKFNHIKDRGLTCDYVPLRPETETKKKLSLQTMLVD